MTLPVHQVRNRPSLTKPVYLTSLVNQVDDMLLNYPSRKTRLAVQRYIHGLLWALKTQQEQRGFELHQDTLAFYTTVDSLQELNLTLRRDATQQTPSPTPLEKYLRSLPGISKRTGNIHCAATATAAHQENIRQTHFILTYLITPGPHMLVEHKTETLRDLSRWGYFRQPY